VDSAFRYSIAAGGLYLFQSDGAPVEAHVGAAQLIPDAGTTTPMGLVSSAAAAMGF